MTCMNITRIGERPFARANLTNSCGSTSRTPARVRRNTREILNNARFSAGRIRCCRPSRVSHDHCTPNHSRVSPRPLAGSHPSLIENSMIIINATQKAGSEKPMMLQAIINRDNG